MATVTLQGNPVNTSGELPNVGDAAPTFTLVKADLSEVSLADYAGKRLVLNIFPSVDTPTCATSVRTFNEKAASLENTEVLCVSADLPFAAGRFCGAEGIDKVATGSSFRGSFGEDFGVTIVDGPLSGILTRAIVVVNEQGQVTHTELVGEIADEPNYDAVLNVLS
ncbi:thiol peroxidase [Marinibactrum halimedae]|uniref:Thiol peroxidase n=1 Tax=Marinibactrum halimedae TaxID=1444977 RepID=A0AA37T184_9GAMM|nr:thiol peroxidase [Marinibactrum halimedae]MCD9458131.1 thiol peroxidase [Marinibactrum halimedae]GLS25065.1 putative thiol peroxidase [Marinibactrum halimedae]